MDLIRFCFSFQFSKMYMNQSDPSAFYNPNLLPNNNANMYPMNHVPFPNLPNGQYTHNQVDNRYPMQHSVMNTTTKPAFDTDRLDKSQYHDNSNSGSSSDSDDSNNNSDSSDESNADKNDKENSQRVVKPFRLNFNKVSKTIHSNQQNKILCDKKENCLY